MRFGPKRTCCRPARSIDPAGTKARPSSSATVPRGCDPSTPRDRAESRSRGCSSRSCSSSPSRCSARSPVSTLAAIAGVMVAAWALVAVGEWFASRADRQRRALVYGGVPVAASAPDDRAWFTSNGDDTMLDAPSSERPPARLPPAGVARPTLAADAEERMLFPTATFAIFFMIVLPLSWALMRTGSAGGRSSSRRASCSTPAGTGASASCSPSRSPGTRRFAARDPPPLRRADAEAAPRRLARRQPRPARLLQVLRLLRHVDEQPVRARRHRRPARSALDPPPRRHLLLHVHGDQLRRRRVPRRLRARRHRDFAAYLSFFPHLVAGPIVRPGELIPQLQTPRDPRYVDTSRAFFLIGTGLFMKVVDRELPRGEHRGRGLRRARTSTRRSRCSSGSTRTRSRSTPTSSATRTSPSASRCSSASRSRRTSTRRTRRPRSPTSGAAGT